MADFPKHHFAKIPEGFPFEIRVRGARHNNLRDLDLDIPLWRVVAIVGVSGSGKTSLANGTLYAEGMQRFIMGLPAYTRGRIKQLKRPNLDRIEHLPPTTALRQRPPIPGPRSTVGTMTELLNVLQVTMSRLGMHRCPNGHDAPSATAGQGRELVCPTCSVIFPRPSSESFSFNSTGACPICDGLGRRVEADEDAIVPDRSLSISKGAVLSWNTGAKRLSRYAVEKLGVPIDVPFEKLTAKQRKLVMHGRPVEVEIDVRKNTSKRNGLRVTYENAIAAAERSLQSESASVRKQAERFVISTPCRACAGTRLRPEALISTIDGENIAQISARELERLSAFVERLTIFTSKNAGRVAEGLAREISTRLSPLLAMGLGYLQLARAGETLSTGELQRIELNSTMNANATGMLYVLDEPSVGLHTSNVEALRAAIRALAADGNSVVVVEHDVGVISEVDWIIELGPGAGEQGGNIVAQGTPRQIADNPASSIGQFLNGSPVVKSDRTFPDAARGAIEMSVGQIYNLRDVDASFPIGGLTCVAGPSGAGKTALISDSLIPAARSQLAGQALPPHVNALRLGAIRKIVEIDATPIGLNGRSTPATYSGALDAIRSAFADVPLAKKLDWGLGHFSFNTRKGQCPDCLGLGQIAIDLQYIPDIVETCPRCHGGRYRDDVLAVKLEGRSIADSLRLSVREALEVFCDYPAITSPLQPLVDVGLGYLRLGQPTPDLSGGESQRLRIASRLLSRQHDCLYVFDEPSIGLHPLDIRTLSVVFDRLIAGGATVIVIDHDLDLLASADKIIDLGPVGGPGGGRIVAQGPPMQIASDPESVTGRYLAGRLRMSSTSKKRST